MARSGFISVITGLLLCISATASTFTVTTTEDRKAGSLRWAVEQANAETEVSNIVFDLPAGSVVALDSTIDIYSSMIFDGKSGDGRIEISASDPWYIFFRLKNVELDSVVFRNLNVYEPKLETEPYSYLKHNGFAEIDTTAGLLSIKDCHLSKFQDMVIVRGDRIDINVANCLCDTMLYDFFACDMVAYNYTSWSSLVIDNSKFIHTRRGGDLHNGGSVKNTTLHKFTNVYAEDIYGFSYGQAAKNVWENCTFYKLKHAAIDLGCDNRCISEILVNNCKFIECGYYVFHYTLDGSNVVFTNNIVYGSGEQDFFCARDYFTNHAGTLRIENNIFGDANHKNTGLITDATNTIIRNNVIYGTNAICNYMSDDTFKEYSFAIFDQGSDTLLIENNLFGTDNEQFIPNEHGDIWLESEWLLDDWRYYGWFNDYDYNLVPQITVKGNTFMRSSPKAIRIDSAKINITFTENIFLETKDSAICNIKPISIPAITNAKRRKDDIVITGKVDSVATIELFHTSGAPQTAEKFLGSTQTNADGDFTISVPFSLVGEKEKICFTATATFQAP